MSQNRKTRFPTPWLQTIFFSKIPTQKEKREGRKKKKKSNFYCCCSIVLFHRGWTGFPEVSNMNKTTPVTEPRKCVQRRFSPSPHLRGSTGYRLCCCSIRCPRLCLDRNVRQHTALMAAVSGRADNKSLKYFYTILLYVRAQRGSFWRQNNRKWSTQLTSIFILITNDINS